METLKYDSLSRSIAIFYFIDTKLSSKVLDRNSYVIVKHILLSTILASGNCYYLNSQHLQMMIS